MLIKCESDIFTSDFLCLPCFWSQIKIVLVTMTYVIKNSFKMPNRGYKSFTLVFLDSYTPLKK